MGEGTFHRIVAAGLMKARRGLLTNQRSGDARPTETLALEALTCAAREGRDLLLFFCSPSFLSFVLVESTTHDEVGLRFSAGRERFHSNADFHETLSPVLPCLRETTLEEQH